MKICTLASSSKGNSTIIYTEDTKILIDSGITIADLERKLSLLRISLSEINAILVTHEHIDHIKSVGTLSRKYKIPVYCHIDGREKLLPKLGKIDKEKILSFNETSFSIGEFVIQAFKVPHDASCCVGYNVFCGTKKMSIVTDLGHITEDILRHLYDSKLVILESNHDEKMLLRNPKYSFMLKNRILGKSGHLSNLVSAKVVCELALNNVKQVVLAHLSEENNTPELCYQTVCNYLMSVGIEPGKNIKIDVAGANTAGPIFVIK